MVISPVKRDITGGYKNDRQAQRTKLPKNVANSTDTPHRPSISIHISGNMGWGGLVGGGLVV
jgi:hypothetical protein